MNTVENSEKRQVMPADFSFLSEADSQIVQAMAGMIYALFNFNETQGIVLSGLMMSKTSGVGVTPAIYKFDAGIVLYNYKLYMVSGIEAYSTTGQIENQPIKVSLAPNALVVDPSPVYNESLEKTINVHKRYVGSMNMFYTGGHDFNFFNELKRIPLLGQ